MTIKIGERAIDGLIFDVEGTLYGREHNERIFSAARLEFARTLLGGDGETVEEQRVLRKRDEYVELAREVGWTQAYIKLGGDPEDYHRIIRNIDRTSGLERDDELYRMLDHLGAQAQLGLLTTAQVPIAESILEKLLGGHWQDLFNTVVCKDTPDCPAEKPDPRVFQFTLRQLGIAPERAAMVGDNLGDDILPAATLGMLTVLVGGEEKSGPWDLSIGRIEELSAHITYA